MAELKKTIGQNIKRLRKLKKWTQAELAEKVDLEPVTIARIETGMNLPKEENMAAIAKILSVEISDFFYNSKNEPTREALLNYIHYGIHNLKDRDLKIIYNTIRTMACN